MATPSTATGLYASASAVAAAPRYAERLVEEAGVDTFILRAGFNPSQPDPTLADALEIVDSLSARAVLLVGTWWGIGMEVATPLAPIRHLLDYEPGDAHEAAWPMAAPGGSADEAVVEVIGILGSRYPGVSICLTHARFKHPADIDAMFAADDTAGFRAGLSSHGLSMRQLGEAIDALATILQRMSPSIVSRLAGDRDLAAFLDEVSGTDVFRRWFEVRRDVVNRSVKRFQRTAATSGIDRFGVNALAPRLAPLGGQDYAALAAELDFVQPLLGYVRWHVLQPVAMWARLLQHHVEGLDWQRAATVAAGLMGVPARAGEEAEGTGEGSPSLISDIVLDQLDAISEVVGAHTESFMPVLRGQDWQTSVIAGLTEQVRSRFPGVIYQGSRYLGGPAPVPGWQ